MTPREQLDAMEKYYLPFGVGARSCIGRHISQLEMVKALPMLLWRYDFVPQQKRLESCNHWFVKPNQFLCKVLRKEQGAFT